MGIIVEPTLYHGDCLEVMKTLDNNSVDLILCDPPYFKVKKDDWDNQWDTRTEFIDWIGLLCEQWYRILKPNGSLYCFASPQMQAHVEVKIGESFNVLNSLVWHKGNSGKHMQASKEVLRGYFPNSERIVFAEHHNSDSIAKGESGYAKELDKLRGFIFEPLRAWFRDELVTKAGMTLKDINTAIGTASTGGGMASHYVGETGQWELPTEEHYKCLQAAANDGTLEYLRKDYEDLRKDYEDLRRYFEITARDQFTDVWKFKPVQSYEGKHPAEKPYHLLAHMIKASSRPGAVVLDSFMGSGATGIAALSLDREFVGIEKDDHWFKYASDRLTAGIQKPLF